MVRRILALATVAGPGLGTPAGAAPAEAAPSSCPVSTTGSQSCIHVGLAGFGRLSLTVDSGFAAANVGCVPIGSAFLGGEAPYSRTRTFGRTGVCIPRITGTGSATASAG